MNKKSGSRPAVRYLLNYHFTLDKYEQDGLASKPQLAITEDLLTLKIIPTQRSSANDQAPWAKAEKRAIESLFDASESLLNASESLFNAEDMDSDELIIVQFVCDTKCINADATGTFLWLYDDNSLTRLGKKCGSWIQSESSPIQSWLCKLPGMGLLSHITFALLVWCQ